MSDDRLKNLAESSANFDAKKFELITGINTEKEGNEMKIRKNFLAMICK